mmetsp:Transcript_27332/g.31197  ORF Transcript_27332/g.31197 Transcript_27332/m.31197 type:complete len:127 (+) Transcript_27332:92-472(+)
MKDRNEKANEVDSQHRELLLFFRNGRPNDMTNDQRDIILLDKLRTAQRDVLDIYDDMFPQNPESGGRNDFFGDGNGSSYDGDAPFDLADPYDDEHKDSKQEFYGYSPNVGQTKSIRITDDDVDIWT